MARIPRNLILGENSLFHVTWQCHNKSWLLKSRWVKRLYYNLLLRFKARYGIAFYSYNLMDNHIHLSGKLSNLEQFSDFFRVVNSMFSKEVNKQMNRCGQVVRDRFKSPCLQTEKDLIHEMIYHDLNEVRAGKATHPKKNELSSYAHYAHGKEDPLITDPEIYLQLGGNPEERQKSYQGMVEEILATAPRKREGRYTRELFIGDPHWVTERYEALKKARTEFKKTQPPVCLSPPKQISSN